MPDLIRRTAEKPPGSGRSWPRGPVALAGVLGCCLAVALLGLKGSGAAGAQGGPAVAPQDFVAVTDTWYFPVDLDGCACASVFDSTAARVIWRGADPWGHWFGKRSDPDPGQVSATHDGRTIVSLSKYWQTGYVVMWRDDRATWEEGWFEELALFGRGGAIAVSPDDTTLLVAGLNSVLKYDMAAVSPSDFGPLVGSATLSAARQVKDKEVVPAAIAFTADSRSAYVVDTEGFVRKLDVASMTWQAEPLAYPVTHLKPWYRTNRTFASMSPGEEWLVINQGDQKTRTGRLSFVDLRRWQVQVVDAPGLRETHGVAFNYVGANRGLLAVHGRTDVGVYLWDGERLAPVAIATRFPGAEEWYDHGELNLRSVRLGALAWSGNGGRLIVSRGLPGHKEFRILELSAEEPRELTTVTDLDSCTATDRSYWYSAPLAFDVVTIQSRATLTPTPLPTDTPTITPTPPPTLTPSITPTASATPTTSATPTITPLPTRAPAPLYLPVTLGEHCAVGTKRLDVALMIDASTSMRDGYTSTGRSKLVAAIEAAQAFVATMALPHDQAAIVEFNGGVRVLQELTGDRAALDTALGRIQVRQQTRIDLGIQAAHAELTSPRHKPSNQAVMIVLTDGRANPVGPGAAVREADAAKQDRITVFTIGLGDELDLEALEQMASQPEYFYRAPDGEDLREIYETIAIEIPCPVDQFWGRR